MFEDIWNSSVEMLDWFSDSAKDLLSKLLEPNPDRRLGSKPNDLFEIK